MKGKKYSLQLLSGKTVKCALLFRYIGSK